jgi:hypothetical protein
MEPKFYYCFLNIRPLLPTSTEFNESKYYPLTPFFLFKDGIRGLVHGFSLLRLVIFPTALHVG